MSSNYYAAVIAGGKVQFEPETPESEPKTIPDAEIFGDGQRDTEALLLANAGGVVAIPNKNADLKALLEIVANIAASAAVIANTDASEGSPLNPAEAVKMQEYQTQLNEFLLS